jgi:hypothetical protein
MTMRRFVLFALGLALCAGIQLAPAPAAADNTPQLVGSFVCGLDLSQGSAWSTLTSASLKDMTSTANDAAACRASMRFTEVRVLNTHASQTLYVSLSALSGAVPTVTNRIPIGPGASLTIPIYGASAFSISIRGSGIATTGHLLAQMVTR